MLYNTGTIAINGNTATGTGTNWTAPASQVRAGQTIIVMSNPVQLFQISSVNSATSITVTPAASPALSGQKYGILVSDIISVDGLAQAMSQLIKEYDENIGAWETFATTSANQSITVTINGTSVTIPGIGKLAQKGSNGALAVTDGGTGATNAADARTNLGLGNSATRNVGTAAGTVAAGDDSRLTGALQKTGGTLNGQFNFNSSSLVLDNKSGMRVPLGTMTFYGGVQSGQANNDIVGLTADASAVTNQFVGGWIYKWFSDAVITGIKRGGGTDASYFVIYYNGGSTPEKNWTFDLKTGNAAASGSWNNNSDARLKENIERVANPLEKMRKVRGVTWDRRDGAGPGQGFIAQEMKAVMPTAVTISPNPVKLEDGTELQDVLTADTSGFAAALHHEAILALMDQIEELTGKVEALQAGS
ncbi:tail fiber domain-containing protein [Salmonella enterica]